MKTLILGTVITSMWQSPLIALLILISLVFLADRNHSLPPSSKDQALSKSKSKKTPIAVCF